MVTRGFFSGRRPPSDTDTRIPPGQYLEQGFPVLSAGPTPRVRPEDWSFTLNFVKRGESPAERSRYVSWDPGGANQNGGSGE